MKFHEIYFDEWVTKLPEIHELRAAVNCLCRYENYAKGTEKEQAEKAQRFFMKVLERRKKELMEQLNSGERNRLKLMELMKKHEPKYQENVESRCVLCGAEFIMRHASNDFGRTCPVCHGEISVYPVRLYQYLGDM